VKRCFPRRSVLRQAALFALPALAGCAAVSSSPERRLFTLDAPRPERAPPRPGAPVLLVRPVQPGPGTDQRGLVTRTGGQTVRTDFYSEFLTTPDVLVGESLRRWLGASGLFAAVVDPGSRLPSQFALETTLTALEGVSGSAPQARIALGVLLLDLRPRPASVARQAVIERSVPVSDLAAGSVAAGLNQALALVLADVEAALRAGVG